MNRLLKNSLAIFICATFLFSLIAVSATASIDLELNKKTQEITLYRYGPDGSVKPVDVEVSFKNGQDLADAIAEKCEELAESDIEIQSFLGNNDTSNDTNASILKLGLFSKVTSRGRGFHFKFKTKVNVLIKFKLFSLLLPKLRVWKRTPIVFCKYLNDSRAHTTITSTQDSNLTKVVEGSHSVFIYNFVGFTSWCGRFSFSPFDVLPRSFSGYAMFISCKTLP
ncbi:MAG: hypothetical protein U9O49_03645 [Candidatus Thermoplasmatota archaeon]|nr:hypothetical protein [Candidatus Thermoplasmatota archaeon]